MIYFLHSGKENPVFGRIANRMAGPLGDHARVLDTSNPALPALTSEDTLVAVWWRAANPYENSIPDGCKLVLCLYDHKSWTSDPHFRILGHRANVITASNKLLQGQLRQVGITAPLCRDGVDAGLFRPGNRVPGQGDKAIRVGWCGDTAVDSKRYALVESVINVAKNKGIEIVVHSRRTDPWPDDAMPDWYRSLDAFLCVASAEGTPNPVLEACASGLPILSTPVGLVPEIIEAGAKGITLLPPNPSRDDVLTALVKLRDNRDKLPPMGASNRQVVSEYFKWDFTALHRTLAPQVIPIPVPVAAVPAPGGKKRILVLGETLGLGGAEKLTVHLANALATKYHVSIGVTLATSGAFAKELAEGTPVLSLPTPSDVAALINESRPDVVIANNCHMIRTTIEAGLLTWAPRNLTFVLHGFVSWSLNLLPTRMPDYATILTMSDSCKAGLLAARPDLRPEQIFVARTGVDTRRFCPGRRPRGLLPWTPPYGPVYGTAGRYSREKDLPGLIHILQIIQRSHPKAKLVSIGGSDPEIRKHVPYWEFWASRLKDTIRDTGMEDSVYLAGLVPDPLPYYRLMDVFLLPSMFEDLPLVLLEAMATGLPIVATAVGAIPPLLAGGGGVAVAKLGEALDDTERIHFAMAALDFAGDKVKARVAGVAARATVVERHSLDAMTNRILQYIKEVCP